MNLEPPTGQRLASAYWLLPLLVLLAGIVGMPASPLPVTALRNAGFDQFQRWQPRVPAASETVMIVDIDEDSLRHLGQWPWPRSRLADLVDRLRAAGAAAIAFDVVFPERDRTSPQAMAEVWQLPAALRAQLADLPDHDALLAQAIAGGRVVVGFAVDPAAANAGVPAVKARFVARGKSALDLVHMVAGTVPSLPMFEAAATGNGTTAFFPNADGIVRRVPMLIALSGQLLPSLAAEALRVAQGVRNYVTLAGEDADGLAGLQIGRLSVATTASGEAWVYYTQPSKARYLPAWQVLGDDTHAVSGRVAGKIVLIGS